MLKLMSDEQAYIKKRMNHLKELKKLANQYLQKNISIKNHHAHTWELDSIENNIRQLKRIISNANKNLGSKELQQSAVSSIAQFKHLRSIITSEGGEDIQDYLIRMMDGVERFEVFTYCPEYSIVYDFSWIPDGTIGEQYDVANGTKSPDLYEKYCPYRINMINTEVIPYLEGKSNYQTHAKLLSEITRDFGKRSFLLSNILLITVAESLVRELCKYVYQKQNPNESDLNANHYIYSKFTSLESLINKGEWKKDIAVKTVEASSLSRFIVDENLNKAVSIVDKHKTAESEIKKQNKIAEDLLLMALEGKIPNDEFLKSKLKTILDRIEELSKDIINKENDTILVTIRFKLCFLVRRYKEDRNLIIHGNYFEFDKGWKSYIYLSAITRIFETMKDYDKIYSQTISVGNSQ